MVQIAPRRLARRLISARSEQDREADSATLAAAWRGVAVVIKKHCGTERAFPTDSDPLSPLSVQDPRRPHTAELCSAMSLIGDAAITHEVILISAQGMCVGFRGSA